MKRVIKTVLATALTTVFASMATANSNTKCNNQNGSLMHKNTTPKKTVLQGNSSSTAAQTTGTH